MRNRGLEFFAGHDAWVLVNYNVHSVKCAPTWIKVIEVTDSSYIVNEARKELFDSEDDGVPCNLTKDSSIRETILTERKEYEKNDVVLISDLQILTTEELFEEW